MVWFNSYVCIMINYKNSSAAAAAMAQKCFRFYPSSFLHFSSSLIQHVLRCSINANCTQHTTLYYCKRCCYCNPFLLLHSFSLRHGQCVCAYERMSGNGMQRECNFKCNADNNKKINRIEGTF